MSKTLEHIRALGHVAHVDDERAAGNSIIVTLNKPFCFTADPGAGVRGFDTVREARAGTALSQVYRTDQAAPPAVTGAGAVAEPVNVREKAGAIAEWLGYQHEDLAYGLRSVADAERLYDYWQARGDTLPEMADDEWYSDTGREADRVYLAPHRVAAIGYDPLA